MTEDEVKNQRVYRELEAATLLRIREVLGVIDTEMLGSSVDHQRGVTSFGLSFAAIEQLGLSTAMLESVANAMDEVRDKHAWAREHWQYAETRPHIKFNSFALDTSYHTSPMNGLIFVFRSDR